MKTTTRTAYDHDTRKPYQIEMPAPEVVRQAILELEWPPEGMTVKETAERLAEKWELNEEQKTAVNKAGYNLFRHGVVYPQFPYLVGSGVLEQPRGKRPRYVLERFMKTMLRTAINPDTRVEYQIDMPAPEVVRQAILELEWPPEGMTVKETTERLAEKWELNEEQKTAVNKAGNKIFHSDVVNQQFQNLKKAGVLKQQRGDGTPYIRVELAALQTTERKQELTQLLQEALENLEIRNSENQKLHIDEYRELLLQYWSSDTPSELQLTLRNLVNFEPHITSETTQSKLLNFIIEAFKDAIHEGYIQSAFSRVLRNWNTIGYSQTKKEYRLVSLLKQLLNIAIGRGVESAVSAFVKCAESESASFQYVILLAGIKVDTEIPVSEGIRIKRFPTPIPELLRHQIEFLGMSPDFWSAQLIIDASVSPIFHKPDPKSLFDTFQVKISDEACRNTKLMDFGKAFSQALALVCNSPVQCGFGWAHIEKDELFYLERLYDGYGAYYPTNMPGPPIPVEAVQIAEAAQLCTRLVNLPPETGKKMKIPIDRWIKSKTSQTLDEQVIDLGIAFEALYLQDDSNENISLQLRSCVAWYLGEDKQHRKRLRDEVKAIYNLRSKAAHGGEVSEEKIPISKGEDSIPTSELIRKAQDLCRKSIMKILEEGKNPAKGHDLRLGE